MHLLPLASSLRRVAFFAAFFFLPPPPLFRLSSPSPCLLNACLPTFQRNSRRESHCCCARASRRAALIMPAALYFPSFHVMSVRVRATGVPMTVHAVGPVRRAIDCAQRLSRSSPNPASKSELSRILRAGNIFLLSFCIHASCETVGLTPSFHARPSVHPIHPSTAEVLLLYPWLFRSRGFRRHLKIRIASSSCSTHSVLESLVHRSFNKCFLTSSPR